MRPSKKNNQREDDQMEFQRFENLVRNLINVSNVEVREKMKEEKRKKKPSKRKAS